jgi:type IV pilus assembly protein PilY1
VDDLRHAAYNGRGQFMNAANPVALKTSLGEIFSEILEGTGVASAVAFNTQNLKSNSVVFRAFFDTTNNTGDLLAHPIDLSGSVDLSTVIWSASEQLDAKTSFASDSRTIITYDGSDGIPFQWTRLTDTSGGQQDQLNSPSLSNYTRSGPVGKDRLEYLRGQSQYEGSSFDSGEFRVRPANKGKLGDLVHSAPVFVGSPPFTGRGTGVYPTAKPYSTFKSDNLNRNELVYIGGNDGMLHAFDAGSGAEVFSYIPNAIFSNLSDLTRPDYAHKFYVDLTPTVNDAYFPLNSTLDWYTVAVGGLGKGGKGYYAFDLTDPSTFDTEDNAADHVMWEFTEADDLAGSGTINLGYSYSEPLIAMGNTEDGSGNKRWVVIFGNGYNSTAASGNAVLYVLFIDGGLDGSWSAADFIKIDTGVGISTSADGSTPNGLSGVRGVDIDLDGTVDHVYAGDLQGNLYRFDLSSSNKSAWASNTKLLFQATYGVSGAAQPITNQPVVMKHPDKTGFIVLFGTGSWMTDDDATSTDIQSIYGVWDDMSNTPLVTRLSTDSQLIEQSFEDKDDLKEGKTVGSLSSNDVDYINTGSASDQVKGWYIDLDVEDEDGTVQYPGERAVRDFLIRGGLVFVNTVLPKDPTSCGPVAGGFTLGFDPVTGGASSEAVFDLNNDGAFTVTDNIGTIDDPEVVSRIRHDSGTPSDSSFIDNILVTNVSTGTSNGGATSGDVETIKTNTLGSPGTGRFSWRELLP